MAGIYLIQGEEFLVDEGLERVRSDTGADPLSEVTFDPAADPAEITTALETPSLLGGRRVVVIRSAENLRKEHIEAISPFIEDPPDHAVLVLAASGRTKLDALVRKHGDVISLDAPRGRSLATWVRRRAGEVSLRMDDRGAWALIDAVGTELRDIDNALQQLASAHEADARIGAAEVRHAFPRLADERVYVLTDAVGERRAPVAMETLRRLLNQGDEPLVVFGALVAQVRRMLVARQYADRGSSAVADVLGLPGWRAEKLTRQARSYKEEELVEALAILARTDVEIKGGGDLPPDAALERAVLQIIY